MIKRMAYLGLATLLFVGCGAKKRSVVDHRDSPPIAREQPAKTIHMPKETLAEGTKFYPMPEDPGRFEKFPITDTQEYIETFFEIAQYEMRAFGIPASITLAQGILESGSGQGELTLKTNNHFGIKCHKGWQGEFDFHDDDAKGECFRKYNHPMFSFRDHSLILTTRSRYAFLFDLGQGDYERWAHGLRQAGYATDRKYPEKLIALIERYQLHRFDEEVLAEPSLARRPPVRDVVTEQVAYLPLTHRVRQGETLYAISQKYGISVEELREINGLKDNLIAIGQLLQVQSSR